MSAQNAANVVHVRNLEQARERNHSGKIFWKQKFQVFFWNSRAENILKISDFCSRIFFLIF